MRCRFKPGSDVALLNSLLHTIIDEKLYDEAYIREHVSGFEALKAKVEGFLARSDGRGRRHRGERAARRCAHLRDLESVDHLLGHGHLAAHARHRQRALLDRARVDHRPDRPAGHGPASAARPEQRAGRFRRGPDPDVLPGLQVRREARHPRLVREFLGPDARSEARPHGRRDHGRRARGRDHGHVHHGRESRDVRPRSRPCARSAREARAPRRAGHLPDRDGVVRRRRAAGFRARREARHLHEHEPPSPDGPPGARSARRGAPGLGAHRRARAAHRPRLEVRARLGRLHRDGGDDAVAEQHFLGARRPRGLGDLSV